MLHFFFQSDLKLLFVVLRESFVIIWTVYSDIKWNQSSFIFLWKAFNISIHFFSYHFTISKTQSNPSVFIWSLFLLLPEYLKYIFLFFDGYSTAWIFNFYFNFYFFLIHLRINLIINLGLIVLHFLNLNFDKALIGVFYCITNKIKNNVLNFVCITFNNQWDIFVKFIFKFQLLQFCLNDNGLYPVLKLFS